jgi:serine O-acetyltransferase
MNHSRLQRLKGRLRRIWILSPERLWLASIALERRGHWVPAFALKQLNGLLYNNSLAPGASVSPDVHLGHNSIGIVINRNVEIGRHVTIWHNVTLAAGRLERGGEDRRPGGETDDASRARIVVEDHVKIGTGAVVIAPRGRTLRIGRGARIGAGTVVTEDVPAFATVVGAAPRVMSREELERDVADS